MRLALPAIAALLALTGCGDKQATGNTNALDQAVTAEDFVANDSTAIDAATGADANMAADVDINFAGNDGDDDARSASGGESPARPHAGPAANQAAASEEPAPEPDAPSVPAGNSAETNSN